MDLAERGCFRMILLVEFADILHAFESVDSVERVLEAAELLKELILESSNRWIRK